MNVNRRISGSDESEDDPLTMVRCVSWIACALSLAAALGCGGSGDKYDRIPFSGTVTLDGEPLASGYFFFEPRANQPTQSGGMILNGKFDVPQEAGAEAGQYAVSIFSSAETPTGSLQPGTAEYEAAAMKLRGQQIPRKYNVDTTLTAEIKAEGENVFNFPLLTK